MTGDPRMPSPGPLYSATLGHLVTAIAVGAVILQHAANTVENWRLVRAEERDARRERGRWVRALERYDDAVCEANERLSTEDDE